MLDSLMDSRQRGDLVVDLSGMGTFFAGAFWRRWVGTEIATCAGVAVQDLAGYDVVGKLRAAHTDIQGSTRSAGSN